MFPDSLVTIPRDDPVLSAVESSETLLRRFDPDNVEVRELHTIDEGSVPRIRLRGGALTGFSSDGCSTARPRVLDLAGISYPEVLEPKHRRFAEAMVSSIRDFEFKRNDGQTIRPFDVAPDAYPPNENQPKRWMVAHALVTIIELTKLEKRVAVGALTRLVFNPLQADK